MLHQLNRYNVSCTQVTRSILAPKCQNTMQIFFLYTRLTNFSVDSKLKLVRSMLSKYKIKLQIFNDHLTIIDVDITMVVRELLRRLASNLWQTSHVSPE
jgi:hypothetical protein